MKISISLVSLALLLLAASLATGDFVPSQSGRTANLLKRSLCNTFGGCGAKRSLMPHLDEGGGAAAVAGSEAGGLPRGIGDEPLAEERRAGTNSRMISEILGDIIEHLQRDQNYRQAKYVMYVPMQTSDGASYLQRLDAESGNVITRAGPPDPRRDKEREYANLRLVR